MAKMSRADRKKKKNSMRTNPTVAQPLADETVDETRVYDDHSESVESWRESQTQSLGMGQKILRWCAVGIVSVVFYILLVSFIFNLGVSMTQVVIERIGGTNESIFALYMTGSVAAAIMALSLFSFKGIVRWVMKFIDVYSVQLSDFFTRSSERAKERRERIAQEKAEKKATKGKAEEASVKVSQESEKN